MKVIQELFVDEVAEACDARSRIVKASDEAGQNGLKDGATGEPEPGRPRMGRPAESHQVPDAEITTTPQPPQDGCGTGEPSPA